MSETIPHTGNLYSSPEDFLASIDEGIKLIMRPQASPSEEDELSLKHLLSIFLTASLKLDPEALRDPALKDRMQSVRLALLAAYNLGRESSQKGHSEGT